MALTMLDKHAETATKAAWPAELAAFAVFAVATIPAWRRYERRG